MNRQYHLFISHSWAYSDAYVNLIKLLDNQKFNYKNYSVPMGNPIHTNGTDKQLKEAIEAKIKPSSCVIILAGVYASYSKWITKEIDIAVDKQKPILAIEPWGSERTSALVKNNADEKVGWNGNSIVSAIKRLT